MVLIAVSGERPEWPGSAWNIGQAENAAPGAALAVPVTASAPARAAPAAAMTSAGLDGCVSFDISMLLALVVYCWLPRTELALAPAVPIPGQGVLQVGWQMSSGVDERPGKDSHTRIGRRDPRSIR